MLTTVKGLEQRTDFALELFMASWRYKVADVNLHLLDNSSIQEALPARTFSTDLHTVHDQT